MHLREGQRWRYRTRDGEEDSRVTVLQVDETVVHIYVDGLRIQSSSGRLIERLYLPLSMQAFKTSVTILDEERVTGHEALHQEWLSDHDTRGQGFFTVELSRFFSAIDKSKSGDDTT